MIKTITTFVSCWHHAETLRIELNPINTGKGPHDVSSTYRTCVLSQCCRIWQHSHRLAAGTQSRLQGSLKTADCSRCLPEWCCALGHGSSPQGPTPLALMQVQSRWTKTTMHEDRRNQSTPQLTEHASPAYRSTGYERQTSSMSPHFTKNTHGLPRGGLTNITDLQLLQRDLPPGRPCN